MPEPKSSKAPSSEGTSPTPSSAKDSSRTRDRELVDKKLQDHRKKGEKDRPATEDTTREDRAGSHGNLPGATAPWVVPTMLGLLLLGVIWIVVFYVAGAMIPFMAPLGNWNLAIGMALIAGSFVVATQWK